MKRILYFDTDGVTCDSIEKWCDWCTEQYELKQKLKTTDILHYTWVKDTFGMDAMRFWSNPECFRRIRPYDGTYELLMDLKANGFVLINITYSQPGMEKLKNEWNNIFLPGCFEKVIHAKDKFIHTEDGVLIDDHFDNIHFHAVSNAADGILYNHNESHPCSSASYHSGKTSRWGSIHYANSHESLKAVIFKIFGEEYSCATPVETLFKKDKQ